MSHHVTFISVRLGDNLAHLHFLRKLAEKYPEATFEHLAHPQYIPQLVQVIADQPRISLRRIELVQGRLPWDWTPPASLGAINAWKNAEGFFGGHALRNDYARFMLCWFRFLAERMGLKSPFESPEDLLFDYPALKLREGSFAGRPVILVINSPPLSGQARHYRLEEMARLILELQMKFGGPLGDVVFTYRGDDSFQPLSRCTLDNGLTVTDIGQLSQAARLIVMVSTGPSWPTFNVWNRDSRLLRIIINEPEDVTGLDPSASQVVDVAGVRQILQVKGIL